MKVLKITLIIITIASISFFIIKTFVKIDKVGEIKQTGNPFIDKIQQEIKAIKLKPENKFCKDFYNEIVYHIEDYYKSNRLGKSASENEKWKEILSKQLFTVYSKKFIEQSIYIFNSTEWALSDLSFIRNEYELLQGSTMIERNGKLDKELNEIRAVINKYNEISGFISSCQNFSFDQADVLVPYPLDDVKKRIYLASKFRTNGLDNYYLNKCSRLHNGLKEVPQYLYRSHVRYLDNLIINNLNSYSQFNSLNGYKSTLYNPILASIEELDNEIYNTDGINGEYSRLKSKWEADGTNAYDYFNSKK